MDWDSVGEKASQRRLGRGAVWLKGRHRGIVSKSCMHSEIWATIPGGTGGTGENKTLVPLHSMEPSSELGCDVKGQVRRRQCAKICSQSIFVPSRSTLS